MNDMLAYYILSNMKVTNNASSKEISEANEALNTAKKALMERKKNLTNTELKIINTALDIAAYKTQLFDAEEEYEVILEIKHKLGILKKEDIVCPKCKSRDLHFTIKPHFGGEDGVFSCKKCGHSFIDRYNLVTEEDWDDFKERTRGIMW